MLVGHMRASAAALVLALAACSGGPTASSSPTTTEAPARLGVTVTAADVQSAVTPAPAFPADVRDQVVATIDRYLQAASVTAITTGKAPAELEQAFSATARPRLATADRQTLADEGLPRARVDEARADVALTALVGPDGSVAVVVARLAEHVEGAGGLTVTRTGDFTLVPEDGGWRIDSYDVAVTREVPGQPATTTTAASP
jgi:hypothetical protein